MPRSSLSNLEIERTRDFLCGEALALYRDEGEQALTFRKLAERAGTSHTHAYRYFRDKAELFAAMRLRCYRRFADTIRQADPARASVAQRLKSIHQAIMQFVREHPEQYSLMFSTTQPPLEDYPALLAVRRDSFNYLVDVVQLAVDTGELEGDARNIMHIGWGAVHGLIQLHVAGQLVHGRDLEALSDTLLSQVFHPLFEQPAGRDLGPTHATAGDAV